MKKITAFSLMTLAFLFSAQAWAQGPGPGRGPGMRPGERGEEAYLQHSIKNYLYSVELVRAYAAEIDLSDAQIEKIKKIVTDVHTEMEQLKWDMTTEARRLVELVKKDASKEDIYAQMDRIFKYENKIKKKHLGMMIVIRDILTDKQKAYLDTVKAEHQKMKKNKKMGKMGKKAKMGKQMGPRAPF